MKAIKQPNILLILCDQLRRDSIGHLGGPVPTPNLDRLAEKGISFRQAYCAYPMCTPARAALLTGRWPHALKGENGEQYMVNDVLLDTDEISIAKILRDSGYCCGHIGKWHNDRMGYGTHVPEGPRRHGFDGYWAGTHASHSHAKPFYYESDGRRIECGEVWEPDVQVELAKDFISKCSKERQNFFLHLSFGPPHIPFDLPPSREYLVEEARTLGLPVSSNIPDRLYNEAIEESIKYHANVMGLDDVVGNLLNYLKLLDIEKDTLVIFTSDHGSMLFNHGLREKNNFYEEAAAIPLIFRMPGKIPAGVCVDAYANLTDIAPTILDILEIDNSKRMQGKSFKKLIYGEKAECPWKGAYLEDHLQLWDFTYGQGPMGNRRCWITDDWKLELRESNDGRGPIIPSKLFDRKNDPYELVNLAEDAGYQWQICLLVKEAMEIMKQLEDPFFDILTGKRPVGQGLLPR